jgi:hypothetical protein
MGVIRPPKERSQAALARRAEKRGRTLGEQRALDRSVLDAVAQERDAGKKTPSRPSPAAAARSTADTRAPPGRPPPPPPPRNEFAPPAALPAEKSLDELVREADGRGMLGHRLEVMGKGGAKVISARAAKEGGGLSVKLYFDAAVEVTDGPPRRTLQLAISIADVDACRFRLADGSRADWHCAGAPRATHATGGGLGPRRSRRRRGRRPPASRRQRRPTSIPSARGRARWSRPSRSRTTSACASSSQRTRER